MIRDSDKDSVVAISDREVKKEVVSNKELKKEVVSDKEVKLSLRKSQIPLRLFCKIRGRGDLKKRQT